MIIIIPLMATDRKNYTHLLSNKARSNAYFQLLKLKSHGILHLANVSVICGQRIHQKSFIDYVHIFVNIFLVDFARMS